MSTHAAHAEVTLDAANDLWLACSVDWPVSGVRSTIGNGKITQRRAAKRVALWAQEGVLGS